MKIGMCVLKHRKMSAQETFFRLSDLKLLQYSRDVVYINCRPLDARFRMLRPMTKLNELPSDSTNVFLSNIC